MKTIIRVFDKAASQDTIVSMFHAFAAYNQTLPLASVKQRTLKEAEKLALVWLGNKEDDQLQACLKACPEWCDQIRALLVLAQMGEVTLFPIFGLTDALGSVMRKKLKPLTDHLREHIQLLME